AILQNITQRNQASTKNKRSQLMHRLLKTVHKFNQKLTVQFHRFADITNQNQIDFSLLLLFEKKLIDFGILAK
ncbi:MAG: esterase/lipase superfamily enzyme, partial [Granulosicoccus sp.]